MVPIGSYVVWALLGHRTHPNAEMRISIVVTFRYIWLRTGRSGYFAPKVPILFPLWPNIALLAYVFAPMQSLKFPWYAARLGPAGMRLGSGRLVCG